MGKKILIIDDDNDFRDAVTMLLASSGYEVDTASDGLSGIEKAKQHKPDCILLDVMMTHKTEGVDIARQFKDTEATKDIPVILVTGIRNDIGGDVAFTPDENWLPVKAVVEKPVAPDLLFKLLHEYIGTPE